MKRVSAKHASLAYNLPLTSLKIMQAFAITLAFQFRTDKRKATGEFKINQQLRKKLSYFGVERAGRSVRRIERVVGRGERVVGRGGRVGWLELENEA